MIGSRDLQKLTDESSQIAGTKPASRPEVPIETEISHDSTQEQLDGKVEHSNDQTAEEEAEKNDSQTLEGSDNTSDHEGNEEQKVDDENDEQPSDEEQSDEEQSDEEQSDEEQSEEEQSEEEQSEEEQSDEDDLEKLLNNAQEALSKQKQFEEVEMYV
ncbi:hypothetical protein BX666DRAFT_514076 [Dichotomocladium elegans]|nr:hypothetical protein BX666DRAFT_514076 [Dichotomocladium elegans]